MVKNWMILKDAVEEVYIFLFILSIKIKFLSVTEFLKLLENCSAQQILYAVWLRYYF